jgi:hypothetical protein
VAESAEVMTAVFDVGLMVDEGDDAAPVPFALVALTVNE